MPKMPEKKCQGKNVGIRDTDVNVDVDIYHDIYATEKDRRDGIGMWISIVGCRISACARAYVRMYM
jgi:hypothetical protein